MTGEEALTPIRQYVRDERMLTPTHRSAVLRALARQLGRDDERRTSG